MEETNLHWLAGWLEGEGTFVATSGRAANGVRYRRVTVRGVSTDLEVVKKVHSLAGVGRIYGPYKYGTNKQQNWQWAICKREEALSFMRLIRPLMSTRRQAQIDAVLAKGEERVL